MRSRSHLRVLAAALTVAVLHGTASPAQAAVPATVALVMSSGIGPFEEAAGTIRKGLADSALQPEILTFDLEGSREKASDVLALLRRAGPSVVITVGSLATGIVLAEDWPMPVVFSMTLYPAQSGFVKTSGGGVTGASLDIPPATQFRMLRRLLPEARRLGVLYNVEETGAIVDAAGSAARRHGFDLEARPVERASEALSALEDLLDDVDAVWSVADSHVFTPQMTSALILASLRERKPVFGLSTGHVRTGALAALSCDYTDIGAQTAELALRVLRGESAASIPPTVPRKTKLALNIRSAKHLGVRIDRDLEREAAQVIR